ncbi:MAG: peptide chain release factor N(5)-glutamine methyltransferase [Bacteroidales bacterium]
MQENILDMRIHSNQLSSILSFYQSELFSLYSPEECESLFYWSCEEILGNTRIYWRTHLSQAVSESVLLKFNFTVKDLKKHKPIQYIFHKAYFYDLSLYVDETVLIPRPETEELLHWIFQEYREKAPSKCIDLCTGSGCIALSLKSKFPNASIEGMDLSSQALSVAQKNSVQLNLHPLWIQANLLEGNWVLDSTFDLIVSNPPYVRLSEQALMNPNVLDYEPALALFVSDQDPLIFYRAIARFAKKHLHKKGFVYLEINEALGKECTQLFCDYGFTQIELRKDMQNKDRMLRIGF